MFVPSWSFIITVTKWRCLQASHDRLCKHFTVLYRQNRKSNETLLICRKGIKYLQRWYILPLDIKIHLTRCCKVSECLKTNSTLLEWCKIRTLIFRPSRQDNFSTLICLCDCSRSVSSFRGRNAQTLLWQNEKKEVRKVKQDSKAPIDDLHSTINLQLPRIWS